MWALERFHHALTNAAALRVFITAINDMLEKQYTHFASLLLKRQNQKTEFLWFSSSACAAEVVILLNHPVVGRTEQGTCNMWLPSDDCTDVNSN